MRDKLFEYPVLHCDEAVCRCCTSPGAIQPHYLGCEYKAVARPTNQ